MKERGPDNPAVHASNTGLWSKSVCFYHFTLLSNFTNLKVCATADLTSTLLCLFLCQIFIVKVNSEDMQLLYYAKLVQYLASSSKSYVFFPLFPGVRLLCESPSNRMSWFIFSLPLAMWMAEVLTFSCPHPLRRASCIWVISGTPAL